MPPRPRTLPIVLAGFTAFLDLYATQPLLPLLMRRLRRVALRRQPDGHGGDGGGRARGAVRRPARGSSSAAERVIVASAFVLAGATALAATSANLQQLLFWRFVQGLATPGVFATTIAYIHDEWPAAARRARDRRVHQRHGHRRIHRPRAGRRGGRRDWSWQTAFVVLALVNLATALALAAWLPRERPRAAKPPGSGTASRSLRLLRNRQLVATNAIGFCVLFTQVAMFTYVTFHLAAPPYGLSTAALGWLFVVYLVGAAVTPFAGHWIDASGHRAGLAFGVAIGVAGALLTLIAVAARDRRRPGAGRDRRVRLAGDGEQLHRRVTRGRSRPGRRAVLDLLLRGRQSRRRAAGGVLDDWRLDRLRRARRRRAARHGDACA